MTRKSTNHVLATGVEDADEFFRRGDDGDYFPSDPVISADTLLAETHGSIDFEQIERQLERRARYTRWVTGFMAVLSLATLGVFVARSQMRVHPKEGPSAAASARRPPQPDERVGARKRRIQAARRIPVAPATADQVASDHDQRVATSEAVEPQRVSDPDSRARALAGPSPASRRADTSSWGPEAPNASPSFTRPTLTAVHAGKVEHASRAEAAQPRVSATSARNPIAQRDAPPGGPRKVQSPAPAYSPPTARFED